jgi:hypothetical protein
MEGLQYFSFRRQELPWVFKDEDVKDMGFGMVFVGAGYGRTHPWKAPGQWWAARKHVFAQYRGKIFLDEIQREFRAIDERVAEWQKSHVCEGGNGSNKLKRKVYSSFGLKKTIRSRFQAPKKRVRNGRNVQKCMSDEWRKRRREQETRAGRWCNGTVGMNRMWDAFHWVLPGPDEKWNRPWTRGHSRCQWS